MPDAKPKPKRRYNRKVFGRRAVERNGDTWMIELEEKALVVRRKRGRRKYKLTFKDLVNAAIVKSIWVFGETENGDGK